MTDYDVIIVGAGPGGLATGLSTLYTNKDANVLIVESRKEVGEEKCAEGLSKDWFKHISTFGRYLLSKLKSKCFDNKIFGTLLVLPSGKEIVIREKRQDGFVLNKDYFLKNLAEIFKKKGGILRTGINIKNPVVKNKVVYGIETENGKLIKGRCVIDATGLTQSIWRKALNIKKPFNKKDMEICFQYKIEDCQIENSDLIQIYFSETMAPGGYGWVFPKSNNRINVGLGCQASKISNPFPFQERFWNSLHLKGKIVSKKGGMVVTSDLPEYFVWSNLACVGASAKFTNPIHGGGTGPALYGSYILGNEIGNALKNKTSIENALIDYQKKVKETRGKEHRYHYKTKNLLQACSDKELEIILSSILEGEWFKSMNFTRQDKMRIIKRISKKSLKLSLKVTRYLI